MKSIKSKIPRNIERFKEIKVLLICLMILSFNSNVLLSQEINFGTVLMYHKFGESSFPSTSIQIDTFRNHLSFLKEKKFNVLPLSELVDFLENSKNLPEKAVFITIDDGYRSFYNNAFPLLKEFNFPFTIFISTDNVSSDKSSSFMSWDMLSEIKDHKGVIHNHTSDHSNLNKLSNNEIIYKIKKANESIQKNLNFNSDIFSYPYGESNLENEKIVKSLGFRIAFSQHSSHIYRGENIMRLPRFSFNEEFGKLDRFKMILESKALAVYDVIPKDTIINSSFIGMGFSTNHKLNSINCFHSNSVKLETFRIPPNRLEIRFLEPIKKGRNRINCTSRNNKNELLWFGKLLVN